jgi:predicted amidohydrolase YtcJ
MGVAIARLVFAGVSLCPLTFVAFGQQSAPDLVLLNGKIFTSNPRQPYSEALAIRGERIAAVGTSKEISAIASKQTKRIDLAGRTVIPGINDAHYHLGVGPETYDLPIQGINPGWQEIKDALSSAVAKVPKGTWIDGVFGTAVLDDSEASRAVLDRLAPDHFVVLFDWTGHASLMNTPALRKLNIREDEPNPEGGTYVRSQADGRLTGMVFEFAQFRVDRTFSELASEQQAFQQLHEFFEKATRWGITTVQNMSNPMREC